tara:strand:+ start:681 stop:974 length:294 start_codon:yes stop_codon:yes gene_type:complete
MIKRITIYIIFLSTLNGCVPVVSLLGPAFSYSQSGNIMQSALSYGSNVAFKKMRDKSRAEKNKNAFDDYGTTDNDYSFSLIKNKIENARDIANLTNQ